MQHACLMVNFAIRKRNQMFGRLSFRELFNIIKCNQIRNYHDSFAMCGKQKPLAQMIPRSKVRPVRTMLPAQVLHGPLPTGSEVKDAVKHAIASSIQPLTKHNAADQKPLWYADPLSNLDPYLSGSLLDDTTERVFQPTDSNIRSASQCFQNNKNNNYFITFAGKAIGSADYPGDELPEVAFMGQSNVGKSSLISALFMYDQIKVPISKTPGKTRKLNFYRAGNSFTLVDLPGYGQNMPDNFPTLIHDFLKLRRNLRRTFLLIDCAVAAGTSGARFPSENDITALKLLSGFGVSCCIVLTKIDACIPSQRIRAVQNFQRILGRQATPDGGVESGTCFVQPFLASPVTGEGIGFLQSFITYVTGNLDYVDRRTQLKV